MLNKPLDNHYLATSMTLKEDVSSLMRTIRRF